MLDAQAADVTYVDAPAFVRQAGRHGAPSEVVAAASRHPQARTSIAGDSYIYIHSLAPLSGGGQWAFSLDIGHVEVSTVEKASAPGAGSEADATAEKRVRLLAKKYEAAASVEDLARLAILTNRISRLAPRTTAADIARIEQTVDEVADIKLRLDSLASEYGD